MREPMAALFVCALGVVPLVVPLKKHLTAKATAPKPTISPRIVSFYRHYATLCETAARNAPNAKMRADLSKMVRVWQEFAAEHEKTVREGNDIKVQRNHLLKGWM